MSSDDQHGYQPAPDGEPVAALAESGIPTPETEPLQPMEMKSTGSEPVADPGRYQPTQILPTVPDNEAEHTTALPTYSQPAAPQYGQTYGQGYGQQSSAQPYAGGYAQATGGYAQTYGQSQNPSVPHPDPAQPSPGYPASYSQPSYPQQSYGQSPYGQQPIPPSSYGQAAYGQAAYSPAYGQQNYAQSSYPQPGYPDPAVSSAYTSPGPTEKKSHKGLLISLVLLVLVIAAAVAALFVIKPSPLFKKVLDPKAVARAIESDPNAGLTGVSCPADEEVTVGNTFTCSATGGKTITVKITSSNGDYTWTPSS